MYSAQDVAKYFLGKLLLDDQGDTISNMKLQKLLYYAQGFHLAIYNRPLFAERIERWMHGPVVPDVYHVYKQYVSEPIPVPDEIPEFDQETSGFLDEVYDVFGQYTAYALRNMTHSEPPWVDAKDGGIIPHAAMKAYFKTRLV